MQQDIDPNTFTQKDLMQHLLQASQHAVTREEMTAQFSQAEQQNKERFEQVGKRFGQAEQQNKERFEQVEKCFGQAEQQNKERFEQVGKRFEQVEKRFAQIDMQLEKQTQAIIEIHQEIKNQMRWSFGMLIGIGGLLLGILKIIVV